ncbi:MAG TPA: response regulator [Polyangiaceae bacterium]|jgi:CheY-like chemotaxis protein
MPTKVLVFESDPAFAGELRNELGKLGCSTTVVDDGNVGLQQAAADRPDLVLLSIELPRMNGFSVCNKLKKDANLKDVPLIIMSSESSDETFEQHKKLRTRAEDYVHKPIAFGELLQHIQSFVPMGSMRPPDGDSSIVIEDDIEVGSTDYMQEDDGTQIAPRPPVGMAGGTQRGMETVDADVDAFADAAFGRLTGSEPPGAGTAVAEARPIHNGASDSATVPVSVPVPARRPSTVPQPRGASVRPPSGVDVAEYEKIREELVRTRARAASLDTELGDARNDVEKWRLEAGEVERLTRELEELKTKLASGAPKTAGISSREFLDLREALNKKDKEILSLKEAQSRKDKEHVESQDKMLALERAKSDLDEKTLALEREAAETKDRVDALSADKDLAKKAADDFKARLEKSRAEGESKDRQISELKAKHAEDLASTEARLAALQSELDQTLANERAEHARALDESEERRKADVEQTKKDREAALAEAREQADRERQEALSAQAAQLKQESDGKMAALHRAHQQEGDRARSEADKAVREAEARHEGALSAARAEAEKAAAEASSAHEAEVGRVRAEGETQKGEALEALRAEHTEKVKGLENDRDSRLAALESRTTRELSEANDKLAKADMDLSAARGELAEVREAKQSGDTAHESAMADVQRRLSEVTTARDELDRKHAAASDRAATLEAELVVARQDLGETRQKLAAESARAERATAKWEADRQSLERAKDAMAVALSQIEEAEGRPLG